MSNNNLTDERLSALIRVARDSLELYEMELPVIDDVMLALTELQQRRAAMLQGAEPVQPYTLRDGWVAVPVEPTHAMINAWLSEVANWRGHVAGYKAMLAEAPKRRID
ncbi:TPA: hypothetical protein JLN09_001796 [Escherichia coli]|nr:hypothetical protein [Escherichia coli]